MSDTIKIPNVIEGKEFHDANLGAALQACKDAGYRALYIPEIVDTRMDCDKDHPIWSRSFITPSVRVAGKTNQGTNVVVYAHVPNYFFEKGLSKIGTRSLKNGAVSYPLPMFAKLLGMEDGKDVFVVDYNTLKSSLSGKISLYKAMQHPQVVPFLGGKERAEKYLAYLEKKMGKDSVDVWHVDDIYGKKPYGRLMCIGSWATGGALNGGYSMLDVDNCGRFLGVPSTEVGPRRIIKERASPLEGLAGMGIALPKSKILLINGEFLTDKQYELLVGKIGPTIDDMLDYSREFMAENGGIIKQNWKSYEKGLKEKYSK